MGEVYNLLPKLTLNKLFITDLMKATPPCFAMGYVEVNGSISGFLAIRPGKPIPTDSTNQGFRFGHSVLGFNNAPVLQFIFDFYDHECYHALVNHNPLVQAVLSTMIKNKDYFFFAINTDQSVISFRSHLEEPDLAGLRTNQENFNKVTCLPEQYEKACQAFAKNPQPPGQILEWVCRDDLDYLDLTHHRLELDPS